MATEFTPIASFSGGLLIGIAAVLLMAAMGRIMGVSGIVAGLLPPKPEADWRWRAAFVLGLVLGPVLVAVVGGAWPEVHIAASLPVVVPGGFLVGLGVVVGYGCTSGHGVCGLSRFSPRSAVATATFMGVAAVVVYLMRH